VSRQQRAEVARHTDEVLSEGRYVTPSGATVDIGDAMAAATGDTVMYTPEQVDRRAGPPGRIRIEVTDESTLTAVRRLVRSGPDPVACLNFASALRPGGSYRSGATGQEESLARSSALVACLAAVPEYYRFHHDNPDPRYSDRVVYSPGVPVFRDDSGGLLDRPYPVTVLTAAAPNLTEIADPEHLAGIPAILHRRAATVLAVARRHGHRRLVLGAWGCGAFGNDPPTVAGAFARLLRDGPFSGAFDQAVFAILDDSPDGARIAAFRAALSPLA
jgi:uncharacterized protein (TIGR02452 family)